MQWNTELMRHTWREEGSAPFRDPDIRSSCMEILNGEGNYDQAVMAACKVWKRGCAWPAARPQANGRASN